MRVQPRLLALALAGALAGCGDDSATVSDGVSIAPAGASLVVVAGDEPSTGLALFDGAGKGVLLLSTDGDRPATAMHVVDGGVGRRAPASSGVLTVSYTLVRPVALAPLSRATLAGRYDGLLGGQRVAVTFGADGTLSPGTGSCRLSGTVDDAASLGGALRLKLTAAGCAGAADGDYAGVVLAGSVIAPAALQIVAENGARVVDLLLFR